MLKKFINRRNIEDIIFHIFLTIIYCFAHFCLFNTIIFERFGKPDYIIIKEYWPIAFLNKVKKALEFIIAKQIIYLAKTTVFYLKIILDSAN